MKKSTLNILYYLLFVAALVMILYKLYLRNHRRFEEEQTAAWIAFGILIAALICRLIIRFFPKWFTDKTTSEEIDKQVHGE